MIRTPQPLAAMLICVLAVACGRDTPLARPSDDERLNVFLDEVFERRVDERPEFQSRLGRMTDRLGEWDDRSDAFAADQVAKDAADLERLRTGFDYEALSEQGKLSYDLFEFGIERRARNHEFLGASTSSTSSTVSSPTR